jgi:hypothetical protein
MAKRYELPMQPGIWLWIFSMILAVAGVPEQMIA